MSSDQRIVARITNNDQEDLRIRTNTFGTTTSLVSLTDVDVTALKNGSILVYNTANNKWVSTTSLSAQDMEGGEF